jgi:hypothetical protein
LRVSVALLAALLAACQSATDVVPASEMKLSVLNGTTKTLALVVNAVEVRTLQPGVQADVAANDLPALPWSAEVRLPTGRSLLALTVRAGDVVIGASSEKGDGTRVDLSCGRIDLWSGPPLLGPAPQTGAPGDCDP